MSLGIALEATQDRGSCYEFVLGTFVENASTRTSKKIAAVELREVFEKC